MKIHFCIYTTSEEKWKFMYELYNINIGIWWKPSYDTNEKKKYHNKKISSALINSLINHDSFSM